MMKKAGKARFLALKARVGKPGDEAQDAMPDEEGPASEAPALPTEGTGAASMPEEIVAAEGSLDDVIQQLEEKMDGMSPAMRSAVEKALEILKSCQSKAGKDEETPAEEAAPGEEPDKTEGE